MKKIFDKIKLYARSVSLFVNGTLNLLYIAANILSGVVYHSLWFFSLTVCHMILLLCRFYLFLRTKKEGTAPHSNFKTVKNIGISLIPLNYISLSLAVYSLVTEKNLSYGKTPLPVFILYTLYSVLLSLYGIFISKSRKYPSYIAYRNLTLTTALTSVYNLVYSSLHGAFGLGAGSVIVISLTLSSVYTAALSLSVYLAFFYGKQSEKIVL